MRVSGKSPSAVPGLPPGCFLEEMSQFYACVFWQLDSFIPVSLSSMLHHEQVVLWPAFQVAVSSWLPWKEGAAFSLLSQETHKIPEFDHIQRRPWDVMMMLFSELYSMLVPLFVPDRHWIALLSVLRQCLGMFPLVLTAQKRDSSTPKIVSIKDC